MVQQGLTEILLGFITSKFSKEEYLEYLKFVTESPQMGKEAKYAASEMIRQDTLWPAESLEGQKQ